ncbi:DUF1080 domain-containing protein [Pelagicoccus sp. NFK12]|uniref:DUF1080 domain-containing protein n=1 Tax=Pelagicoccus enzymogenes TaxID=2773457 RepID=A0A927FDC0_9BACT|nr:DUF1080 domain-containing protein [Pelagicoccus enzymogenes]MBD5782275.1 DUF1080 domain-containing protein [Pelagicoccus enzymogenes]MDQ8197829.1 DUF1080 domain-containing protein [Pelagicoccus enzymogenes]
MKIRSLPLAAAAIALSSIANADDGWTYLFQDTDLNEFYFDFVEETEPEDVFEIKSDGTLSIKGEGKPEGYIQTLDEYENYEIKFEYRWPAKPGKSGIQIHSTSDTAHGVWPESIEIQLEPERSGDFWVLNTTIDVEEEQMPSKSAERNRRIRLTPKPEPRDYGKPKKKLEKEPDQWNAMHIVAEGDTIKVYLNEKLVNVAKNASVSSGFITIQAEESDLDIRNFRIREL